VTGRDRAVLATFVGLPVAYAALAFAGVDDRLLVFIGVLAFVTAYSVLDVMSYPTRPIPGEWLRRRITVNLVYMAIVGVVSLGVARLIGS
jgi:hypothetical protein